MRRAYVTVDQTWEFDPELLKTKYATELANTLADGRTEEDFLRESVAMITEFNPSRAADGIRVIQEETDVRWSPTNFPKRAP